jgi:CRAL/TRIO domain
MSAPHDVATLTEEENTGTCSQGVDAKSVKRLLSSEIQGVDGKRHSYFSATLQTFNMRGGKDKNDDTLCASLEDAMIVLESMVEPKRQAGSNGGAWDFSLTPLEDFDANEKDLLRSFVLWSRKQEQHQTQQQQQHDEKTAATTSKPQPLIYNVSKAFRRLESYIEWMNQNARDFNFKNSEISMKDIARVWDMKMTHDKQGRLVWFCDLEALDFDYIKHKLPHDDTLRYLVWLVHLILFDKGTQENGVVLVYSIGKVGLIESLTLVPLELQHKFDSLSIGRLPIRVESIIMFNNPTWMKVVMALVTPFLSRKMTRRLKLIKRLEDPRQILEDVLGSNCFPANMMAQQLQGTLENDLISERFDILTEKCIRRCMSPS